MKFIESIKQNRIYLFFACIALFLFALTLASEGTYGGSDDYVHYRFARYAFKYPHFYLDHWAKPVFTLLASPFAQFGYTGIKVFNLLAGLSAAWIAFLICRKLNLKQSWLVFPLLVLAPIYLSLLLSGMTEILFSLFLIASVYLCLQNRYIWAAILLSFLPFVRNEGIVIIPFFALYFLLQRRYMAIPMLLLGFILYSVAGWFYYHDIFWVISKMPYTGAKEIYGSGSLLHFVNSSKSTFGLPLVTFACIGALLNTIPRKFSDSNKPEMITSDYFKEIWLLVLLPFLTFLVFHSVLWWKGAGGSLGLTRVMASVVPLVAILGVLGLDKILQLLKIRWLQNIIILLVLYLITSTPFQIYRFPVPLSDTEKIIRKVAAWADENGYNKQRVYYYNPYYCHYTGIDPYDPNCAWEQLPNREIPSKDMMIGSIVIWDSQFGPNEGKLPVERILNDSLMLLLKVFRPLKPFQVLNGYNYEVCVFKRLVIPINPAGNITKYNDDTNYGEITQLLQLLNFEKPTAETEGFTMSDTLFLSGKKSCLLTATNEFSPTITFEVGKIKKNNEQIFEAKVFYYKTNSINADNIFLTASIDHKNKVYFYEAQQGKSENTYNNWVKIALRFQLPDFKSSSDKLKIYVWNKNKQTVVIDDFSLNSGIYK